jgi:hypothetical protein
LTHIKPTREYPDWHSIQYEGFTQVMQLSEHLTLQIPLFSTKPVLQVKQTETEEQVSQVSPH